MIDYDLYLEAIPENLESQELARVGNALIQWFERDVQIAIGHIEDEPEIESWYLQDVNMRLNGLEFLDPISGIVPMPNTWNRVFPSEEISQQAKKAQSAIKDFEEKNEPKVSDLLELCSHLAPVLKFLDNDSFRGLVMILDLINRPYYERQPELFKQWIEELCESEAEPEFESDDEQNEFYRQLTVGYFGILGIESDTRFAALFEVDFHHIHGSRQISGRLYPFHEFVVDAQTENKYRRLTEDDCAAMLYDGIWVCTGPASRKLKSEVYMSQWGARDGSDIPDFDD